uniref:Uncharacterized protein n=1 Tax=Rhodosorus marinus TaxID=101924 RepID=A0A7S3EAH1_9RHOD|mmetsp:Transcript_18231/g.73037  ORF Transcript_18231/g.73037 Transcript_18231/m.73037 type:complete len:528 (+) Transcript_18231:381-1964(+)|eukprot:CAMPEP_0113960204 /NCGR_PEP_ID=MMETSP0011_2-20120614/4581_1 /TAXON_ID=101924 /ORGANISM="Rhodosorus marinus" /LENGTH=527 /DNA_ID=CAMNT_0000971623 /DNA_START=292 /DNA_END=1875 /DNA_ORIENTATION=+ /assembly_acc=CAM_ASM_000156
MGVLGTSGSAGGDQMEKGNLIPILEEMAQSNGDVGNAGLKSHEMIGILNMVFSQAGLDHSSSPADVRERLGDDGSELIVRFYQSMIEKDDKDSLTSESMTISSISDEEEMNVESGKSTKYKKETEIALSRIFSLGNVTPPLNANIAPFEPYHGKPVITMTGFGELGRFGNQLLQYAFLRCYAKLVDAEVQVPYWVGKDLFGLQDDVVQRALPAVIETRETKANSTFTDEFLQYITQSNDGMPVPEILPSQLNAEAEDLPVNVDIWGWFQWHTSVYKQFKESIQDIFTPVPSLKNHFDKVIDDKLRQNGKRTVVGCHLRLGDYKNIAASSFGYVAPTQWYLEWLEEIWPTLENPVLFVASDEVDTVLRDFAKFNPVTSESLGAELPESFADLGAGMFPDWYILSQCDVLAISNSTFSFSACMANRRPNARFFRAHYADKMVEIDPWNADVIVHRDMKKSALAKSVETLRILYDTQGSKALLQNIFFEIPYYGLRSIIMKSVLLKKLVLDSQTPRLAKETTMQAQPVVA